jgi:hypothetical protein
MAKVPIAVVGNLGMLNEGTETIVRPTSSNSRKKASVNVSYPYFYGLSQFVMTGHAGDGVLRMQARDYASRKAGGFGHTMEGEHCGN